MENQEGEKPKTAKQLEKEAKKAAKLAKFAAKKSKEEKAPKEAKSEAKPKEKPQKVEVSSLHHRLVHISLDTINYKFIHANFNFIEKGCDI